MAVFVGVGGGGVFGIQIRKVKAFFTRSHNSVNTYCYLTYVDFHDHPPNIFQISKKKLTYFRVFFSESARTGLYAGL